MPPYLLDTNHCIAYLRSKSPAHAKVQARLRAAGSGGVFVSHFTVMELSEGPWLAPTAQLRAAGQRDLSTFLAHVPTAPLTSLDAEMFGRIKAHLRLAGQMLGDLAIAIATTAVVHGLTLVTNDSHFQRLTAPFGLQLDDWFL